MLVELVEHQAHAVHQAVHVPRSVVASRIPAVEQGRLERLKVAHPLDRKVVRLDVGLVEDEDEGKAGLVEDTEDASGQLERTRCDGREGTNLQA